MAENSKIEWTDHTVNLWWGCAKVHTGCKNCYAEVLHNRFDGNLWGENSKRRLIKSAFSDLRKYQKRAEKEGVKYKIFMGSMMDIFEESKPTINSKGELLKFEMDGYSGTGWLRYDLFSHITADFYPNLIFLFLTKRPENIRKMIPPNWKEKAPNNVWFGTSISDSETFNNLVPQLIKNKGNKFLSIEPQTGEIDSASLFGINWVIQGGESGNKKRPFDIKWAYRMKQICKDQNIPFFFKQIDKVQKIPVDLTKREFPNFGSVGKNILELETETSNEAQK